MSLSLHEAAEVGRLLSAKCKPKPTNELEKRIKALELLCEGLRVTIERCERKVENHALGRVLINGRPVMGHPEIQEVRGLIIWLAKKFGTTGEAILSTAKPAPLVVIRHIAMWLARKSTYFSAHIIGRAFRRNYTGVLYAVHTMDARIETEPKLKEQVESLLAEWIKFRDEKKKHEVIT